MKGRVLITGASGFVGYHLIEEALKNNLEVFAAVRKSSKTDHLAGFDIQYTCPDFNDVASLKRDILEKQYDYIIHAAGITSARSEQEYNDVNAGYTNNLALAVQESGIRLKKFVLISSLAAVGPLNTLEGIITETTPPHPITAYGRSKLLGEENLKAFPELNYTILRPTGVYGPRDRGIFIFFKQVSKGIEPYIGRDEQKFSFIYAADLARAAVKALYAGNRKTYNLSDGNFYGRYELGDLTKSILNQKTAKFHLPVKFVKFIAYLSEKYCYLSNRPAILNIEKLSELIAVNWYCSIAEAKADLGFSPEYDLRSGLTETLNWYRLNKWI
ncbi:MAG TPA: NAD(P)-dependent oxidoreductase [Mucilaginibacter sp.]|jgi:UDP-glucose 4-epimerase|nr:NAD(P)-dependent oxidoreductase [Mucilaginibacter sp.]